MKEIQFDISSLEQAVDKAERVTPAETVASSPVRTFNADVAHLLEQSKPTKLDIVMAEKARRLERQKHPPLEETSGSSHLGKTIFILVLLLAFGIGIGIYALIGSVPIPSLSLSTSQTTEETPKETHKGVVIDITDSPREQILVDISTAFSETTVVEGSTHIISFGANGKEATASMLLTALGTSAPPQDLLRSLGMQASFMVRSAGTLSGVILLRSRSYPETFSGMLIWESKMGESLIPALRPDVKRSDVLLFRGRAFKDERILELNARVLSDPIGNVLLAYAFPDKQTLIIAGSRETLRAEIAAFRAEAKR